MYIGNNNAIRGCQEYFNRCAAAGSPIGATQTPTAYDNAASFNGSSQFLSIPSNSSLTVTGTSFTYAFWANTPNTSNGMVISKTASTDTREFQIGLDTGGAATFRLFPDGIFANSRAISTSASSFSANTWNFFVCRYDSSAATIGISINGGAFTTLGSIPAITQTNTNPLNLGVFVNTSGGLNYTGQLASVGFWKKALTASEVTQLFNSGAGRTYASLDSGLRANLISWWALNGSSSAVSLTDSHGGNTLTNSTTPVTAPNIGPVANTYADPRQLIVDFAQGIDQLGLWDSMVCWPLRASQNASTTLTARSLGGLGTFDGTLVGLASSSWLSNGLNMPNNTGYITFPSMSDFSSGITTGSVHSINVLPSQNRGLSFEVASPINQGGLWSPFSDGRIYWDCLDASLGRLSIASGAAANTYYMWSGSSNGTSIYLNASQLATGGVSGGLSNTFNIQFGRSGGTLVFNGNASFVFILRSGLTQTQVSRFYSQYSSTLGLGLNLPLA